ncbi:glycosyltransferase [Compostibacter hankyongensis]|uniref:Glycosyltransferase family 4 protein n=1 Tax=Compostibacter hankyongensis TaxID=1007089 RepID=A0ABP8G6D1_9BACT
MKILFLASYFPNRVRFAGPFIKNHARVAGRVAEVSVLTIDRDDSAHMKPYELVYTLEEGLPTVRVYYRHRCLNLPLLRSLIRFSRFFRGLRAGYRMLREKSGHFDLVHLNVVEQTGLFALWLSLTRGLPYVVTEHSSVYVPEDFRRQSRFKRLFHRICLRRAREISVVSRYLQNCLRELNLAERCRVVPNVVDTRRFFPGEPRPPGGRARLLHVSNLKPLKGVEQILRTLPLLTAAGRDTELHILGESEEYEKELRGLSGDLGLGERVFFHGQQPAEAVAARMRESHMLVLNSAFETFGVVITEALACGIPVVAPATGAIPEQLQEGRGFLLRERSAEAICSAICHVLDHYADYDPQVLRRYVQAHFSEEAVEQAFRALYASALTPPAQEGTHQISN